MGGSLLYSFVSLMAANDLSFHFRVIFYVWISFRKSVCSYLTFRRNKNCLREVKTKPVSKRYLEIAESYYVLDNRFGIYECFCCSRTATSVPDRTDLGFGFAMVEIIPSYLESCFLSYRHHSLYILLTCQTWIICTLRAGPGTPNGVQIRTPANIWVGRSNPGVQGIYTQRYNVNAWINFFFENGEWRFFLMVSFIKYLIVFGHELYFNTAFRSTQLN